MSIENEILYALQNTFQVSVPNDVSKENILKALQQKISELLQGNAESFFQILYRLDISERKVVEALKDSEHAIDKLAELIYERQLQKAKSRIATQNTNHTIDDEMKW